MSDTETKTFQFIAPYSENALYIDSTNTTATVLPNTEASRRVIRRASRRLVTARNIFVPFTITLNVSQARARIPPLTLYITPSSIDRSMSKVVTENRFRRGPEPEFWGDNLDAMNITGPIAAFYDHNRGITHLRRGNSAGFQNFISLLSYYKNNGREYWPKGQIVQRDDIASRLNRIPNNANRVATIQQGRSAGQVSSSDRIDKGSPGRKLIYSREGLIKQVKSVTISYDGYSFSGHFDSFTWTEDVNSPFQIQFQAQFTVDRTSDIIAANTGRGLSEF